MIEHDWTCPYCGRPTTITDPLYGKGAYSIGTSRSKHEDVELSWFAFSCPSKECKELTVNVNIRPYKWNDNVKQFGKSIFSQRLLPESSAKALPKYIPQEINSSYVEASRIVNLSPKASATLARRCLQGRIRDFWKISDKLNLFQEIEAIKEFVSSDTWEAIDAVRNIGNIGAHMEQDVNLIVDVDPKEAAILIQLIESLFEDWYIERHKRQERNAAVKALADTKKPKTKQAEESNVQTTENSTKTE